MGENTKNSQTEIAKSLLLLKICKKIEGRRLLFSNCIMITRDFIGKDMVVMVLIHVGMVSILQFNQPLIALVGSIALIYPEF